MNIKGVEKSADAHRECLEFALSNLEMSVSGILSNEKHQARDSGFADVLLKQHMLGRPAIFLVGGAHAPTIYRLFCQQSLQDEIIFNFIIGPKTIRNVRLMAVLNMSFNQLKSSMMSYRDLESSNFDNSRFFALVHNTTKFPAKKFIGEYAYLAEGHTPLSGLSAFLALPFVGVMHQFEGGAHQEGQVDAELPESKFPELDNFVSALHKMACHGILFKFRGREGGRTLVVPKINCPESDDPNMSGALNRIAKMVHSEK